MIFVGQFRVYFNRHGAAPRTWCVALENGLVEITVCSVGINVPATTAYRQKPEKDEDDGLPSAWIACEGQLTVLESGHASIGSTS